MVNPGVGGYTKIPNQRKILLKTQRQHSTKNLLKGY